LLPTFVNICATVVFSFIFLFNYKGYFNIVKHAGIILANLYVYFQSIVGGPELQFQYAYCIILTMIGLVFTRKKYLFIHLPITIVFFILTKVSYYYIDPIQYIAPEQRDYFAFNNGIIFLILISVSAIVFRNQTNVYLKEIEQKKNMIEEKQKETFDSINYAQRIQSALMSNTAVMDKNLGVNNYFLFFQPKDIVSGDFYWTTNITAMYRVEDPIFPVNKMDELFYLAICDSTGHGVPGAFMSLLNMGFINEAIKERRIYEPNRVFDFVRKKLIESISQKGQQDGFDGLLLCINKTNGKISYAAANCNPVIVSNGELTSLGCDKMPVGSGERKSEFRLFPLNYQSSDMLYVFSDGYADQFGGPKGKKFKYKQLNQLLLEVSSKPLNYQCDTLSRKLNEWKGNLEQVDDICLVGIKI
jgi:serine phosphatase RsbU (regulator of sigma subunit)